jgi:NTE family protein
MSWHGRGEIMELKIDLSKEYGIVLEGGGARGAYQIGAWKALREAGVKIKGIAGASVGALNGAMMCMDAFDRAEEIWKNLSYSSVMDMTEEQVKAIVNHDIKAINTAELLKKFMKIVADGGIDITPLRKMLSEVVDEKAIRSSPMDLYVTTFSVEEMREKVIDIKNVPEGEVADMLMASAYFPAFKKERIGGKLYQDGGGFNNVPIDVLTERGYKDIIVLRIYGLGFDTTKKFKRQDEANIQYIAPRQDLGGILEFDSRRCRSNMRLGYYDAQRFLYGLAGRRYYLDTPEEDEDYLNKLEAEAQRNKVSRFRIYKEEEFIKEIIDRYTDMLTDKTVEQNEEETV